MMAQDNKDCIHEEYQLWKKNAPQFYDCLSSTVLEWPSLTVEWFANENTPDKTEQDTNKEDKTKGKKENDYHVTSGLLLGTHSSGVDNDNHVLCYEVDLPTSLTSLNGSYYDNNTLDYGGLLSKNTIVRPKLKMAHEGEVNRARHMPQNQNIIASKAPSSDVFVFDRSRFMDQEKETGAFDPSIRLKGHTKEGYGLSWNKKLPGHLISSGDDCTVCLWDISGNIETIGDSKTLNTTACFTGHSIIVEDVSFHPAHPYLFGSVDSSGYLMIWDTRSNDTNRAGQVTGAHTGAVNCLDFSSLNDFLVLTGSCDNTVAVWDMRFISKSLHVCQGHDNGVYQVKWSPHSETIFGSAGADRRLNIWDLGRIGQKQDLLAKQDGPPELLFIHGGHTAKISDFSWHPEEPFMIASVAEDSVLQCWKMAESNFL